MKRLSGNVDVKVAIISAIAVIITGIIGAAVTITTVRIQNVSNSNQTPNQTPTIIYNVNAPSITPVSTPQHSPKPTPASESTVIINLPSDNAVADGTFIISGEYSNLKEGEDDIWVFVFPESANGLAWPQTDDLYAQKSATKADGKWQVTCSLGGKAQESHRISVYTGTKAASDSIRKVMKEWLSSKPFCTWGMDIPSGLAEKAHITVAKKGES